MERREIVAGLRNAIDRGYSLEMAISSFINAGYGRQDVIDSAKILDSGIISENVQSKPSVENSQFTLPSSQQIDQILPTLIPGTTQTPQAPQAKQFPPLIPPVTQPNQIQTAEKPARLWPVVLLVVVLILLLGFLGMMLFAKETLMSLLSTIGL